MSEFFTMGEPVVPDGPPPDDADHVHGQGWLAERTAERIVLSWDSGEFSGRMLEATISDAEFDRLRDDKSAFRAIALTHEADATEVPAD